jgi:hypothetical protein
VGRIGPCGARARQLRIDPDIDGAGHAFRLTVPIEIDFGRIEGIESHLHPLADQMRRGFIKAVAQPEGGIAADQAEQAVKEEPAEIGGRRQWADLLDVALPTAERRGPQRAMDRAVVDGLNPGPQSLVEFLQAQQRLGVQAGQELFSPRAKEAFYFSPALGLIGRGVDQQDAQGGRNAGQLLGVIDAAVVDVETQGSPRAATACRKQSNRASRP